MERRNTPRTRCAIACEVRVRGRSLEGRVRNVSEGGLALEVALASPAEGEPLALCLKPPRRPAIDLVALVWHVRATRREGAPAVLGLVLSQAGDDYFQWLASLRPAPRAATLDRKPSPPSLRQRFSVQVAQAGSPRSRRILVVAPDAEGATARALAEVGPGWTIVGIEALREPATPA